MKRLLFFGLSLTLAVTFPINALGQTSCDWSRTSIIYQKFLSGTLDVSKLSPTDFSCLTSFASAMGTSSNGCSNAESEAYDGYRDARKAYRASSLSRCKRYAKKAYRHLSYAESEADDCD